MVAGLAWPGEIDFDDIFHDLIDLIDCDGRGGTSDRWIIIL
jgi:hypothetical protein